MKKYNLFLSLVALMSLASCKGQEASSSNSVAPSSSTSSYNPYGDENVVDIVVLAGQSNMEGHTWINKLLSNTPESMHNYYLDGFPNTEIMYHCNGGSNKSEFFTPVRVGMGFDKTRFGPEVGIAQKLHKEERVRPLYIVKYALGATNLANDWASPSMGASNSLYHKMMFYLYDQIAFFEEQDLEVRIKGLFWMQGEADSCNDAQTAEYYDNLSMFVEDFRTEFEEMYGDPERGIAFVDAGISNCSTWKNYQEVNAAKKQFAESDPSKNYYFDTMDEGLTYHLDNQDYFHYDALSEIKLGELFISQLYDNHWLDI
jgi:hypothetical protein